VAQAAIQKAQEREAKTRLTDIITQEVSLVDMAANLRRFIAIKRGEMQPADETTKDAPAAPQPPAAAQPAPDAPPAPTEKAPLALPAAAKQTMMDGLAGVLEQLTAVATIVGEAGVDEAAAVPPELVQMLGDLSMMLTGLADQFAAPAPAGEPEGEAAPAEMATGDEDEDGEEDEEQKAATGDDEEQEKAKADDEDGDVAKAGRKIAGRRLKKLVSLSSELAKLLEELGHDPGNVAKSATADDDTDTEGDELVAKVAKAVLAELAPQLDDVKKAVVNKTDAEAAAVAKANDKVAELSAALRSPGESRVGTNEGSGKADGTVWANDMAADVAKRRFAEAG